jgi:ABC-type transporter Mla MlaB component
VFRIATITRLDDIALELEGSLSGPWVAELRRTLEEALLRAQAITVDLGRLRYLDLEGAALLRAFAKKNVIVLNCSPFISEQLRDAE